MKPTRKLEPEERRKYVPEAINSQYVAILSDMVNCKTVFTKDGAYQAEYDTFYRVLETHFPRLSQQAERLRFGSGCFVYGIRGKNAKKNVLLMSHHDVVDGSDKWKTDPFRAQIQGDSLYGRGTIDTKTPLFAELEAAEELLAEGYEFPGINLYIGSSNNEEVSGDGMVLAAAYFKEHGIFFDTVLDEGGAILSGQIPGIKGKSAMIAVHEKSRHLYNCRAESKESGHSGFGSAPVSPVVRMSRFIAEVDKAKIFRGKFYPETKAMFSVHAPYMSFPLSFLFGNIGFFSPVIKKIMSNIPTAAPMLTTGISFQSVIGVNKEDAQFRADTVEAKMLLRCIREDDLYSGLEKIREIAAKHGIRITEEQRDYCKPTDFTKRPFQILEETLHENFPDVIVAPFLLTAGTDARRFTDVADSILRFAPIDLDKEQFASVHGEDEHIKLNNIGQCVCFYKDFIRKMGD